jgi:hypothetical protein
LVLAQQGLHAHDVRLIDHKEFPENFMREFARSTMPMVIAVALLILGTASVSMAGVCFIPPGVPEIDPATAASAIALIGGAVIIIRSRRKR